ncbi:MAG: response regulator transcription factor [Chloroflexi bacterium]|nr:response regulator transcription factor [Chloroflexota bacterium]
MAVGKIRVLIADDHNLVREGIRMILAPHPDIEVVGEAADGREAVAKALALLPDVLLLDIAMPGLGGLEAAMEVRKQAPQIRVLVLTQYGDKEYIHRFLKLGVAGYVMKRAAGAELLSALRAVYRGGSFLDPSIAPEVIEGYLRRPEALVGDSYNLLTDREKQVLKLVAEGHTNQEIADLLGLSVKTVMAHRASIMDKLGLHSRTELVKYAISRRVIPMESPPD